MSWLSSIFSRRKFSPFEPSHDAIYDVMRGINGKSIVVLYNSTSSYRIFHSIFSSKGGICPIDHRVIYINCDGNEHILIEGKWIERIRKSCKDLHEFKGRNMDNDISKDQIPYKLCFILNKEGLLIDEKEKSPIQRKEKQD